jgi:hypothetical protein
VNPSNTLIKVPLAALQSAAWFDDDMLDVPAGFYFFGFNSPGPNESEPPIAAALP